MGKRSASSAGLALMSISSRDGWYISERSGGARWDGDYSDKGEVGNIRSQEIENVSFPFFYSQTWCPYLFIIPSTFASSVIQRRDCWGREYYHCCFDVLKTEQLAAVPGSLLSWDIETWWKEGAQIFSWSLLPLCITRCVEYLPLPAISLL